MIVAAAQPYFAPYPGFFAKAFLCDTLVLLDSVQFPQRTCWMTRNRFKNEQGTLWMTVPVRRRGQGFQEIREVQIDRGRSWARKHMKSLKAAYGKAPFLEESLPFLEELFANPSEGLLDFNLNIIRYILSAIGLKRRIVLLSELGITEKEPGLTVEVSRALGANVFLAQRAAGKFLDGEAMCKAGVELRLFVPRAPVYPQLYGPFIANLSTLDLLFNCGPKAMALIRRSAAACTSAGGSGTDQGPE